MLKTLSPRFSGISMSLSSTVLVVSVVFTFLLPCKGHIASISDDGRASTGYIFRVHPKQGETKPPFLNYARVSRGPANSRERLSASGESRLLFLKPPSFTHKYLPNQHLSKFYQNSPAIISSSNTNFGQTGGVYTNPGMERIFNAFASSGQVSDGAGLDELSKEEPTFTPYIGARALSNMGKFFEHLRENLEALQKDESSDRTEIDQLERRAEDLEDEESTDEFRGMTSSKEKSPPRTGFLHTPSGQEWKPIASGDLGLKKVRSFFPLTRPTDSRRMGTNFGIGRKRRR